MNNFRVHDQVTLLPGGYWLNDKNLRLDEKKRAQLPPELTKGKIIMITPNAQGHMASVDWEGYPTRWADLHCLDLVLPIKVTTFQPGDEVILAAAYTLDGVTYPQRHPGIGSVGTVVEIGWHRRYGTWVDVSWTHVERYVDRYGAMHPVLDDLDLLWTDMPNVINRKIGNTIIGNTATVSASCLELVSLTETEIQRTLESIESASSGTEPPPLPIPEHIQNLFRGGGK